MSYNNFLTILVIGTACVSSQSALGAEFIPLGKLRPTDQFSDAYAVSADGSTIVGTSHTGTWHEAVRWTSLGIQSLGAGQPSQAFGVSADGSVVAGYRPIGNNLGEPIRWTAATGIVGLGDLPGGLIGGVASDVSVDGSVVVGSSNSERGGEAFRWTAATGLVGLGLMPGTNLRTFATGVSADGNVVVGNGRVVPDPQLGEQAFRWTAQTGIVGLGDLPGGPFYSEAFDVSADGSIVVGRSISDLPDYQAFRWTEARGMIQLPSIPGIGPPRRAEGISGDGTVIVGIAGSGSDATAFVWDSIHGSRTLTGLLIDQGVDLTGWDLDIARSASFNGLTLVGNGTNPNGQREAWMARLDPGTFIPEPSSFVLAAIAAMAVIIGAGLRYRAYARPR